MINSSTYNLDEHLPSPSPYITYHYLSESNSPDLVDFNSNDISSTTSNSSPPQLLPISPPLTINPEDLELSLLTPPDAKLKIIAEPKAFYRERYCSEIDPKKNRAQRFIRSEDDQGKHEYPTIQIPSKWRDPTRDFYIRVTLVTITSNLSPEICIHPYAIDTQELDVIRDIERNALYFPITREDMLAGEKSFRISRKKMIQHDLRSYGLFRLFDRNEYDIQRVHSIHDAKQIIEVYQLWKSQLVFTVAEHLEKTTLPVSLSFTSVISQIMCDEASGRRKELPTENTFYPTFIDDETVKCTPRKGNWTGGDEILMVIPKLDRRKAMNLYFDYGPMGRSSELQMIFVDSKTILFQTPPCLLRIDEQNLSVQIVVAQNDLIIASIEFVYLAPNIPLKRLCPNCQFDTNNNCAAGIKRPFYISEMTQFDSPDNLIDKMSRLTTEEKFSGSNTDDSDSKFDKYLLQLQEALAEFVRTNNPSKLFRRTRLLLAKCTDESPPIDDAIRNGHTDLVLKLIEQVGSQSPSNSLLVRENQDGQTPLLVAAKYNQWILIETILKKRLDFIDKIDHQGNNILHLLAEIDNDQGKETIEKLLKFLSNETKQILIETKNLDKQTPSEIAQLKNNSQCVDLLETS